MKGAVDNLRKRIKWLLQVMMGSTVGLYLGYALWLWIDFQIRPEWYAMMSAPWYTGLLLYGLLAIAALLLELAIFLWIQKKERQETVLR